MIKLWQGLRLKFGNKILGSQLRVNVVSGAATTFLNVIITGISYPVYLHYLGYEQYGVWIVLFTILNVVQLGNLGIGPAVMKLVAEENASNNIAGIEDYISSSIQILLVSGIIAFCCIILLSSKIILLFNLSKENAVIVEHFLPYMGLLTIYVFIVQALSATLSGLGRMDCANYCETGGRVVALIISFVLIMRGHGIESLLIGNVISYISIHIALVMFLHHFGDFRLFRCHQFKVKSVRKLLHFGGGIFGGSLISMLLNPFNKLMISRYLGVASVPIYEISYNASMQIRGLFEAGFRAISPEVSRVNSDFAVEGNKIGSIKRIYRSAMKLILFAASPFWLMLLVFIVPMLQLWLGERYLPVLPAVFRIILFGVFLSLAGVPAFYVLMGLGRSRHIFMAFFVQAVVNFSVIILMVITGSIISIESVAFATSAGMGCASIYLLWQKHLELQKMNLATK